VQASNYHIVTDVMHGSHKPQRNFVTAAFTCNLKYLWKPSDVGHHTDFTLQSTVLYRDVSAADEHYRANSNTISLLKVPFNTSHALVETRANRQHVARFSKYNTKAASSMRLVRLKPQGRGPDRPVQWWKFTK